MPSQCLEHEVPRGWKIRDEHRGATAITQVTGDKWHPVADSPVVITRWVKNVTSGNAMAELAWKGMGEWRTAVVDRETVVNASRLMGLANSGFPVSSSNSRRLSQWLERYESVNKHRMPVLHVSQQMGWQKSGAFLAGREWFGGEKSKPVEFHAPDAGEAQMCDAIRGEGDFDAWREGVAAVKGYPRVELALYAALAPPLLKITGCANFGIDWSYQTSTGKTTTLRVAASVWGCPDERDPGTFIQSWDVTPVFLERLASALNHLPLIVDDTKRAQKVRGESIVPGVIYAVANGKAKSRGSTGGARATPTFRTILLTTGESKITDASKDGGTVARCVSLWAPPFGEPNNETGRVVQDLNWALTENYGHAGPRFVRWVIEHAHEHAQWKAQFRNLRAVYAGKLGECGGSVGVANRVGDYLALLELTGRVAHRALELPWRYKSPVDAVVYDVADASADTDRPLEALKHVYAWAVGQRERFYSDLERRKAPSTGWLGRWDCRDEDRPTLDLEGWDALSVLKPPLLTELRAAGFDPDATISLWGDRGWLKRSSSKHDTAQIRINGQRARAVTIQRAAIEHALGPEGAS